MRLRAGIYVGICITMIACGNANKTIMSRLPAIDLGYYADSFLSICIQGIKRDKHYYTVLIRLQNNLHSSNPIRYYAKDIKQYQSYMHYYINDAKNDLILSIGNKEFYPITWEYISGYNAFPIDQVKADFLLPANNKQLKNTRITFIERLCIKDTLIFNVNLNSL